MNLLPFESSHQNILNGGKFVSLSSIDDEINRYYILSDFKRISASMHARDINLLPFDASQWEDSNGGNFVFLRSLDPELFNFKLFLNFCKQF